VKVVIPKSFVRTFLLVLVLGALTAAGIAAVPEGAQVAVGARETRTSSVPQNVTADAGNVTNDNITVNSQTQAWQGFYGEVNGSLVLEDASGDLFYSWNITNVSGEVYASRDNAINFANIFANNNCSIDNGLTGFGRSDSGNNTYSPSNNREVQIGNIIINVSTSCATYTYVNDSPQSAFFHNIIVSDDVNPNATGQPNATVGGNTSVYVALIENNIAGFDSATHDYQLLVPVNRTSGFDIYAFYAELS
jgi:hypothetical protein